MVKKILCTSAAGLLALLARAQAPATSQDVNVQLLQSITDSLQLHQRIDSLLAVPDEGNYLAVFQYYQVKKNASKAGEVEESAKRKWPAGKFVVMSLSREISAEKDIDKKAAMFERAVRELGKEGFEYAAYELASAAAGRGDKEKMLYYADKVEEQSSVMLKGSLAMQLAAKNPEGALPLLKTAMDTVRVEMEAATEAAKDEKAKKKGDKIKASYLLYASSYTRALIKAGKPDDAWQFVAPLYDTSAKFFRLTEAYLDASLATKRFSVALPLMEQMIMAATATPDVKAKWKEVYVAVKGSAEGYEAYVAAIDKKREALFEQEIAHRAIHKPASAFVLKDVDGNTVSLADYKGKVLVLDFWATWCGPCKASFPSMQIAVNKYKRDTAVQFFFIHTLDKGEGDPVAAAAKYVRDNHYDFRVLMDLRDNATGESAVCDAYGIEGIPTKFVIDTRGNIRFQVTGFGREEEKAVAELSAMIEFAKKNR